MPLSIDNLRVGHVYELTNHGEHFQFTVLAAKGDKDFELKDTTTLEKYVLTELTSFGLGKDYDLREVENDQ